MNTRQLSPLSILAAALFVGATTTPVGSAPVSGYPSRPVRLIATNPGTPGDVVVRILSEPLGAALGQPIVVDNRPGAINTIALDLVAKATADGHTLGVMGMPATVAPALLPRMPYDTTRDLAPIRQMTWVTNILVVRGGAPLASVANLVAAAKAQPNQLTYASGGNGTPAHLAAALFAASAALKVRHVPFRGAMPGVAAVMGEHVDFMFATVPAVAEQVRAGQLRALATSGPARLAAFPDVPTLVEQGYRKLSIRDWHGIVAPRSTPGPMIARIAAELGKALAARDVRARLAAIGVDPATDSSPAAFGDHIRAELERWSRVVRDAGIQAD